MRKLKLGVIFGGISTENEVSCVSAVSIIKNLDSSKYDIFPIFISKKGEWFKILNLLKNEKKGNEFEEKEKIDDLIGTLKNLDCVFPVLHGLYGEDGTIQGLFEMFNIPYVGCGVLASSVGMDKIYSKIIFDKAKLNQTPYVYLKIVGEKFTYVDDEFNELELALDEIIKKICEKIKFPMFVKPSNSGSSVGVNKVKNKEQLKEAILVAKKFDRKILVEQGIDGKEVECAVLGNDEIIASCVGEIMSADEFYNYDSKYNNQNSKTLIPAQISKKIEEKIRELAKKAFKAIDGKGLSRVDFFVEKDSDKIYINEINTLPGFTNISMYPKLFKEYGIEYSELLDRLINLALK